MRKTVTALLVGSVLLGMLVVLRLALGRAEGPGSGDGGTVGREQPVEVAQDGLVECEERVLGEIGGELPEVIVDPAITVVKSKRTLALASGGRQVKTYRIGLGSSPVGDKQREGDGRTPEGDFYVCTKNPESRFHRSLGLSYPSIEDADRGLTSGLISKRQHSDIVKAVRQMRQPPWNTGLGGEIMIHGGGTGNDWTDGCVALSDEDAEELFDALPLGTPVTIRP